MNSLQSNLDLVRSGRLHGILTADENISAPPILQLFNSMLNDLLNFL